MREQAAEIAQLLAPDPTSARLARREVTRLLEQVGLDEMLDTTVLLVSELVTNAVLHAGSEVSLRAAADAAGVRVEVGDRSVTLPSARPLDGDDDTGRGVGMVEMLATAWGIIDTDDGKVVWFEVGHPVRARAGDSQPGPSRMLAVQLEESPVELAITSIRHIEASLRELALVQLAEGRTSSPGLDLGPVLAALIERGSPRANVEVELPAHAAPAAWALLSLFREADTLAAKGDLLTLPALPEVAACAVWLLSQIGWQLEGGASSPWRLPPDRSPVKIDASLDSGEHERLQALTGSVIAADDAHRIVFVSDDAAAMLGWDPVELVGRRLTSIVPAELREAHHAGFGRHQVTGEGRILGRRVEVPALHRNGEDMPITLTVTAATREQRPGTLFVAWLEPRT